MYGRPRGSPASSEESVTVPEVVGILKLAFIVSVGTGSSKLRVPPETVVLRLTAGHVRSVCSVASGLGLSSTCPPVVGSVATQSGKMMRSPSTPLPHRVVPRDLALSSLLPPPPQYHLTRAPLTPLSAIILRSLAKGLTARVELATRPVVEDGAVGRECLRTLLVLPTHRREPVTGCVLGARARRNRRRSRRRIVRIDTGGHGLVFGVGVGGLCCRGSRGCGRHLADRA